MSNCIVMIPSDTAGASLSSPAYATVEDALQGARFLLDSGGISLDCRFGRRYFVAG